MSSERAPAVENRPDGDSTQEPVALDGRRLGEPRRLSESPLWQLQRAFYERRETLARRAIPSFITSNRHIAYAYAARCWPSCAT